MNELNNFNQNNVIESERIDNTLLKRFLEYLDASEKTVQTYTRALRQFFKFLYENNITQPQRTDVLAFRDNLKDKGRKPTTIKSYIVAVRLFFQWTNQEGLYPNIAEKIKGAKLDQAHKKDYLTVDQIKDVLNNIDTSTLTGARDYAIIVLMVTGGLRTIEVSRADMDDMRNVGNSPALYIQGKGREEKTEYVKLPLQVFKAIGRYREMLEKQYDVLFVSTSNNNKGQRLTTRSISGIVKKRLKEAGYTSNRLTAHSLRHTAGTLNLMNGGTLEETQQLLRHSNINTTMIYLHHLERENNQSEKRIADALF
ncbi:tyrosine-type recombinase/integrase [Staphylococcus sp.]|uniref:tyrosine-type recombinase/integrase n=1 Tax=Staphylococcus sp. TaxID=29387 RepID=UPI00290669E2|nr:tyrosine-type recombinase/integrase [Staphylococcus sp.]MDU3541133.1 tyrosine-type recombinase/integrase [Staphylococcus sp.]MDU4837013.1 tyrosine-type recombinase/integrase [Staphylococcus sp.]